MSEAHPVIPRLYEQDWRQNMRDRDLILQNAVLEKVPHYEHDNALFHVRREQLHYNVESSALVQAKYPMPKRSGTGKMPARRGLYERPALYQTADKARSAIMYRWL